MERHIQADNAFIKWMEAMSKNVVHIANAWYAAVKWADSHPQWIPVEERKPQENQRVRAWSLENNEEYLCDYHDGIFEDFYGSFTDGVITHWMEIVPPRKEDKE